jgi:hypothetical protein
MASVNVVKIYLLWINGLRIIFERLDLTPEVDFVNRRG